MRRIFKWFSITLVIFLVSTWTIIFSLSTPPLLTQIDYSRAVLDSKGELLRMTLSRDGKYRLYTPLAQISPLLISATLLQEDQYFHWHIGINPFSMLKAMQLTYLTGKRRVGASTITMQVARMRYHIQSKTWSGKIWQILRALQLETHYTKNQILEAYLNLAPYGNNVEGVGAASFIYFGKPPAKLSLPEALTLTVIPQNPTKRMPNHILLKEVRNKLFSRWLLSHPNDISKEALMALPLQINTLRSIPFLAPHFVNDELMNGNETPLSVSTTLDLKIQRMIERVAKQYIAHKSNQGVNNTAILLVDTRDMGIKAMLGSVDFFNRSIGGQINGTSIKRSPGSTLKPFIYALALDQGLIHPATILKDVPRSFGSYNPENFDNDFMGPLKAKDALILSRNIPAIMLAEHLHSPSLYEFLQQAEVPDLRPETYYGLALVLGGAEMSMQSLVSLYAALANEGMWQPLRYHLTEIKTPAKRLLSPEASFLVLEMLKETTLPHEEMQAQELQVAWKTGTSSGYRDAWTVGIVGPYVLAVWVGNFNNQGNPIFIGKETAAPLFFNIIHALRISTANLAHGYPIRPTHLREVEVCKASGMLPTPYCPETEKVWFIPGRSPITSDTIHREIAINRKTGLRACHFDGTTRFEVYEFWSSDLLAIYKRAGIQRRLPPPYDAECEGTEKLSGLKVKEGMVPQIISPQTQVNYVVRFDTPNEMIIPLTAVVDADVKNIYWFLNATFMGKTSRDQSFLWHAQPGNYTVRAVDDYGRSDARSLTVKLMT